MQYDFYICAFDQNRWAEAGCLRALAISTFALGGRAMRSNIIRVGVVIVGVCFTSETIAETRIDEAVRLSKLTLSAIECANLVTDPAEGQRLANIGLDAGKKFLDLMPKLSGEEQKVAGNQIAVLWGGVIPGPSVDFVLGRVWQEMERITYERLGNDTKKWKDERIVQFAQKNCMIIR